MTLAETSSTAFVEPKSAVRIDPEFASWIMPLASTELDELERSLKAEGCRDALLTWNGLLVDGHHRFAICEQYGIEYKVRTLLFTTRDEAKNWMIRNQLGRRNITPEQRNYLIGKLYQEQKKDAPNATGVNQYANGVKGNNCPQPTTADRIGEQFNVAPRTVKNAEKFAEAVDTIANDYGDDLKQEILSREVKVSQKAVVEQANVHFSSESEEWYTPAAIVDAVHWTLAGIDIDPCSNSHEKPNVPAKVLYTKEDDGLTKDWNGRLYMNPPYGREVALWVNKAIEEIEAGRVTEAVILVAGRMDTQWFKALGDVCLAWCAIEGRLNFSDSKNSAPFPSAVFYYGENLWNFYQAFKEHGKIWRELAQEEADCS